MPQGAGKTTLVRALCAEIDPLEAIGTFETEYELHLHELRERHPIVHAWEARPGSGERGPDGRQAGEFTLDEALFDSFRFNLSRQIVGEVRGQEIWAMIKAMESGTGSISTTHASDAVARDPQAGHLRDGGRPARHPRPRDEQLAATIDLVVHLDLRTTTERRHVAASPPGRRDHRRSTPASARPATPPPTSSHPTATGRPSPRVLPDDYRALAAYGFDLDGYLAAAGGARHDRPGPRPRRCPGRRRPDRR